MNCPSDKRTPVIPSTEEQANNMSRNGVEGYPHARCISNLGLIHKKTNSPFPEGMPAAKKGGIRRMFIRIF